MGLIKARGIVLKETFVGESDKILTIFSKDYGKISVGAKGARKVKSKFLAGTQLFTYSDFIIMEKTNHYYLSQVEIIEGFYNIRSDYDRLCYANYFLEVIDKSIMENMESNDILLLLLKTLKVMCNDKININLIARIFELKFLEYSGYKPQVNYCGTCGKDTTSSGIYFSQYGLVCNKCRLTTTSIKINDTSIYAIKYILSSNLSKAYNFNLDSSSLKHLQEVCKILMHKLDINIKSAAFIGT